MLYNWGQYEKGFQTEKKGKFHALYFTIYIAGGREGCRSQSTLSIEVKHYVAYRGSFIMIIAYGGIWTLM